MEGKGCVGPARAAPMCCALELEQQVLDASKGREQGAAGDTGTEDAGEKRFIPVMPCSFRFLTI